MSEQSSRSAAITAAATVIAAALTVGGGIYLHQKTSHNNDTQPTPTPISGPGTGSNLVTQSPTPVSLTQNPTPDQDLTERHKPRLISAIRLADYAQIEASRTLNPAPLYKVFTGESLRMHMAEIEQLKSNNLFAIMRLEDQQFQSFKVSPDGLHAEVRVIETWSTTYYLISTQQCFRHLPSHQVPQTIFLERKDNQWVVDAETQDNLTPPDAVPC